MTGEWNEEEDVTSLLLVEPPSATQLSCAVRFRAFAGGSAAEACAAPRLRLAPGGLCVHKRRRLDDAPGLDAAALAVPLLRALRDPLDVAQRRLETLRWLEQPRAAEEIAARFALDRRLGATPSLAATHRAIARLRELRRADDIADLAESTVMDSPRLSIWTVLRIVEGLEGQPQRAARMAFALSPLATNGALPASAWIALCHDFDRAARAAPAPIEASLVDVFGKVLRRVCHSGPGGTVDEALVVFYGQALLKSGAPIAGIVELVRGELLSRRNIPPSDTAGKLRLAAFISDVITAVSRAVSEDGDTESDGEEGEGDSAQSPSPFSLHERLTFCSDLVKYAYTCGFRLVPSAMDALLCLCDHAGDYHRLAIVFLATCVLSTPSLVSSCRAAEVLCDVPELSRLLGSLLQQPAPALLRYVVLRHAPALFAGAPGDSPIAVRLCECLGLLCARDGDAALCMDVFVAVADAGCGAGAHAFVCAARGFARLSAADLSALQARAPETLFAALCPSGGERQRADSFRAAFLSRAALRPVAGAAPVPLDRAVAGLFAAPEVYGAVIDASALCALAASDPLAAAFAKMMNGYAARSGAVALVPFDVCAAPEVTAAGRALLLQWLERYAWLVPLPLSVAAQLAAGSRTAQPSAAAQSCLRLFHEIRRVGHAKVAFVTDDATLAVAAKAEGVQPVITLLELKNRLGF